MSIEVDFRSLFATSHCSDPSLHVFYKKPMIGARPPVSLMFHVKFEENLPVSYTKRFLDFGREPSEFLKFLALEGLVTYKSFFFL